MIKTWGPIVQAVSGLTFSNGLPGLPPAGWGYSYMDHTGAYFMAMAIMLALHWRDRTGQGQYVDVAATESALALNGPVLLDYTVNGRALRRPGYPDANHSIHPRRSPHGNFPAKPVPGTFDEAWIAIACRDDYDWLRLRDAIDEDWAREGRWATIGGRLAEEDELDRLLSEWTRRRDPFKTARMLQDAGVPAAPVQTPRQRIDQDPNSAEWGLWPTVEHEAMGRVRVDGIPIHMSETDWAIHRGAGTLGQHSRYVFGELLGLSDAEIADLSEQGVL